MTPDQLGRLFKAFTQAEAATRSKYGGDLTVKSVYGQGSTFTVSLPAVVTPVVTSADNA